MSGRSSSFAAVVGMLCFYVLVFHGSKPDFSTWFNSAFTPNFGRKLGGMLWMELSPSCGRFYSPFPASSSLFSYAATPYILAMHPQVTATDALKALHADYARP
jgi:hypothetical protein